MSSTRFVSAGNSEQPSPEKEDAWRRAEELINANRDREQTGRHEGGKSLYEHLQANKEAKELAFQESLRLKNQIQALTDDDLEHLERVAAQERAKATAAAKQASEDLAVFREQQEAREKAALEEQPLETASSETWSVKRRKRKISGGQPATNSLKVLRKTSATDKAGNNKAHAEGDETPHTQIQEPVGSTSLKTTKLSPQAQSPQTPLPHPPSVAQTGLGLSAYSSDDED